ncbi:glycosyltransferase [Parabacteroides chinchillae]|uniref:Dolichol-phosphate mannosyltransferase n=1 Tax=Parabacteroides chinchillae TaxID=871327 RepID=A0A8G2F1Q9_9BACT|nr:glycosyltransferase [Parabacteroides chinchillae]SEF98835.1 dolichol-phosphate mannosyltransferase [Parabacteroides chinchillae]
MSDKLLSIILLSYYSGERICTSYFQLKELLDGENIPFEFIVMDDGSTDMSFEIAKKLGSKYSNVKAYQLSRNYTSNYSWFAGLSVCKGACAIALPDDEQQPYHTIIDMYRLWEQGHKVIIPNRITRDDPWSSRIFSICYYKIINVLSEITYPEGGADLAFIDREVIDVLNNRIHPINTAVIPEIFRLGFSPLYFPYERPLGLNQGKSRWTFKKKIRLAKDVFFSSSSFPIKFITNLGFWTAFLSVVVMIFYGYIALFGNRQFWGVIVPGWVSIILFITFFGGLILLSLGIIAEYIWRIYEEVKGRPGYIIKKNE